MSSTLLEHADSLQGHPNITTAARFLGVAPATISRRNDLARDRRGERDVVLAPREVMRLADVYRKRPLNEVAAMLIVYAEEHAPAEVSHVEEEIENFIDKRQSAPGDDTEFLATAKTLLSAELYSEVERVVVGHRKTPPRAIVGSTPKGVKTKRGTAKATPAKRATAKRGTAKATPAKRATAKAATAKKGAAKAAKARRSAAKAAKTVTAKGPRGRASRSVSSLNPSSHPSGS